MLFDWGVDRLTDLVGCSVQTVADPEQLAGDQVGRDRVAVTALTVSDVDHYLHLGMVLAEILEGRKEPRASTASDDRTVDGLIGVVGATLGWLNASGTADDMGLLRPHGLHHVLGLVKSLAHYRVTHRSTGVNQDGDLAHLASALTSTYHTSG